MDRSYQSPLDRPSGRPAPAYCTQSFRAASLPRLWIAAAFVLSRLVYYAAGVRFDAEPLWTYFQFVEPDLLRARLWESLFYLHMQPPGLNLIAGLALKAFPSDAGPALHAVFLAAGLVTALCVYELQCILGVPARLALTLAVAFSVSPGMVLYENLLLYEPLSLAQLLAAAVLLHRFATRPSLGRGFAFQAVMLSLMLVRNSFHLPYFLLMTAVLWWWMRPARRTVLLTAALPLLVMTALHAKNWILFGQFTTSTWLGLNAGTVTTHQLNAAERIRLNHAGVLSPVGMLEPAGNLSVYKPYIAMPPKTGIGVLDLEEGKRGRPNFNHLAYLQVHRFYIGDARRILVHYPKAYLRSVAIAWFCYFLPPGDLPFFRENRERIHGWDRLVNLVVFGQWKEARTRKELREVYAEQGAMALWRYTGIHLAVALPALFFFGLRSLRRHPWSPPQQAVLAFLLYNIASLTLLSNFLSSFENNRYRVPVDGFYVVLTGMALWRIWAITQRKEGIPFLSTKPNYIKWLWRKASANPKARAASASHSTK